MQPQFKTSQVKELVDYFLPRVSRTFALNIKRLSSEEYIIIGIAYLICRILDTVEDAPENTSNVSNISSKALLPEEKANLLKHFATLLKTDSPASAYMDWTETVKDSPLNHSSSSTFSISENPYENELLIETPTILGIYQNFPPIYHQALKNPIIAMAEGMARFIHRYKDTPLKILKTYAELEEYCNIVAGTVGIILTQIFSLTSNTPEKLKILQTYSIDFALSLQLVNIVKDFPKDQTRGWVYIPLSLLQEYQLTPEEFLNRTNPHKCKAVQLNLLKKIETHLKNALSYTQALSKSSPKERGHRLFCWLPLIMATQTVALLRKQPLKAQKPYHSKITRQQIYCDLLTAPLLIRSNFLLQKAFSYALKEK